MDDGAKSSSAADRSRISLDDPQSVKHWTQKWAVTEDQLRRAVGKAGTNAEAVALQLGRPIV